MNIGKPMIFVSVSVLKGVSFLGMQRYLVSFIEHKVQGDYINRRLHEDLSILRSR